MANMCAMRSYDEVNNLKNFVCLKIFYLIFCKIFKAAANRFKYKDVKTML